MSLGTPSKVTRPSLPVTIVLEPIPLLVQKTKLDTLDANLVGVLAPFTIGIVPDLNLDIIRHLVPEINTAESRAIKLREIKPVAEAIRL